MLRYIAIYNSHPFILSLHMNKVARGTLHLFWFKLDSYLGMIDFMFAIGYRITHLLHVWNKHIRTNSVFLNHIKRIPRSNTNTLEDKVKTGFILV